MIKRFIAVLFLAHVLFPSFGQTDTVPTPQWRPVYHFTPLKNWTNDPNGLLYIDGAYHLYHQYNPFENKWGHMSWGHATSKDLLHWRHLPVAMEEIVTPDTISIFSGSAVWDHNNSSGLCKAEGCMIAIFTGNHSLRKEKQYISYSNDTGRTFTFYDKNPVIDLNKKDFRDPSVFWYEKGKYWLMTVALPTEHKISFYRSSDLKDWTHLSDFGPEGYAKNVWECPFLIRLPVDGSDDNMKWVLVLSTGGPKGGPSMQYFVGNFDGEKFTSDHSTDTMSFVDYGDSFYAAIPWNGLPGDNKTFIGWLVPGPQQTHPWKGQMSIPRDLSLKTTSAGIKLIQTPAAVIKNSLGQLVRQKPLLRKNIKVADREINIRKPGQRNQTAYWLEAEIDMGTAAEFGLKVASNKKDDETVITYDRSLRKLVVDRSKSPNGEIREGREKQEVNVIGSGNEIRFEILVDNSSLEIFVNDGEEVLTTLVFPGEGASGLSLFASGGQANVEELKVWDMSSLKPSAL